jgi:hypothetical protein
METVRLLPLGLGHEFAGLGSMFHSSTAYAPVRYEVMASNTSLACPGEPEVVDLTDEPKVINPNGRCIVKWRVDTGRVDLIDLSGRSINIGPEGGDFPAFWPVWAKASEESGGAASMHYKLVSS